MKAYPQHSTGKEGVTISLSIMSENSTFSPVLTGRERTAVPAKSLSFVEGVSMIVGTNIGAGVLSIAYASSKAGFLPLLFWLVLVGSLTTVTMLYVAESTLRTRKHLQLSGLSVSYTHLRAHET